MEKRSLTPLAGAFFVVFVIVTFAGLWGNTPPGDTPGAEVISYYEDNGTIGMVAAVMLALSAIPLLVFASAVRERLRATLPEDSVLPSLAFGAGVVGAAGFTTAASAHFAVADYADDVDPAAAQAINAIDADLFLAFSVGIVALVLALSLTAVRSSILPTWMGWAGIALFVLAITPAGAVGFPLSVLWIAVSSVMLYRREPNIIRSGWKSPATGYSTQPAGRSSTVA
jgi:hypothetical protein